MDNVTHIRGTEVDLKLTMNRHIASRRDTHIHVMGVKKNGSWHFGAEPMPTEDEAEEVVDCLMQLAKVFHMRQHGIATD